MNKKFYLVSSIMNEMSTVDVWKHGVKKISRRMPTALKIFTVAPLPVIPNAAIGIGTQFARDPKSRKIRQVMVRRTGRNIGTGTKNLSQKIKGMFKRNTTSAT